MRRINKLVIFSAVGTAFLSSVAFANLEAIQQPNCGGGAIGCQFTTLYPVKYYKMKCKLYPSDPNFPSANSFPGNPPMPKVTNGDAQITSTRIATVSGDTGSQHWSYVIHVNGTNSGIVEFPNVKGGGSAQIQSSCTSQAKVF